MTFCHNCGHQLTMLTEKFCPNCGQNLGDKTGAVGNKDSINISGNQGDVFGVGFSGSGNMVGKNIVVGSGTINISKQELSRVDSQYAKALMDFSDKINQQLQGHQIPEEQVKDINISLNDLAKEVKDVKSGQEEEEEVQIDYAKQTQIESKTATVIQKVLNVLPQAAETAATFTPLAPLSKLIGKGVEQIVDAISNRKKL